MPICAPIMVSCMAIPEKKLLFMGGEFGQHAEWNHNQSLDWHILEYELHKGMQAWVRDLNHFYKETPALYYHDSSSQGFEWLDNNADHSVFVFMRRGKSEDNIAIIVSNFTPVPQESWRIGVPFAGFYEERLNSDASQYGGSNMGNLGGIYSENAPYNGKPHSISVTLPPLATVIFTYRKDD